MRHWARCNAEEHNVACFCFVTLFIVYMCTKNLPSGLKSNCNYNHCFHKVIEIILVSNYRFGVHCVVNVFTRIST